MSANLQKQADMLKTRTDSLESILGQFISSMNSTMIRQEADTRAFKNEMNKRWGELANKMGTFVEDIVAPNIPGIAAEYFGDRHLSFSGVRIKKPKKDDLSQSGNLMLWAVSEKNFYINETKSKPRTGDVRDFVSVLEELPDYFPECRDRKIIPVFSSLYIPENIVINLTLNGICAMAMRDDTMDLLNFDEVIRKAL